MSDYNLDADPQESFEFVLGGNTYKMRYPTTEEVQTAQSLKDATKQLEWVYGFITPENPEAQPIEDALKTVNVKVLQKFNAMIKAEFNSEG
jgi:hypothetical protein